MAPYPHLRNALPRAFSSRPLPNDMLQLSRFYLLPLQQMEPLAQEEEEEEQLEGQLEGHLGEHLEEEGNKQS